MVRPARLGKIIGTSRTRQGDSLSEIKIRDYTCGLIVTIVGLACTPTTSANFMAALTLFSVAFFFLAW